MMNRGNLKAPATGGHGKGQQAGESCLTKLYLPDCQVYGQKFQLFAGRDDLLPVEGRPVPVDHHHQFFNSLKPRMQWKKICDYFLQGPNNKFVGKYRGLSSSRNIRLCLAGLPSPKGLLVSSQTLPRLGLTSVPGCFFPGFFSSWHNKAAGWQ